MGLDFKLEDNPQQPQQCSKLLISSQQRFKPMITHAILKIISISICDPTIPIIRRARYLMFGNCC